VDHESIQASKRQWLAYFEAGNRHDLYYNLDEMMSQGEVAFQLSYRALLTMRSPDMALAYGMDAFQLAEHLAFVTNYFGTDPVNPTLGISGYGLHFPTLPALPWQDVSAVIISNQLGAMAQASNGGMLETPPVGDTSRHFRGLGGFLTVLGVVTADGYRTKSLSTNSAGSGFVSIVDTPRGRHLGQLLPPLDPFLGPEQMVEFLFLLHALCQAKGIKVYHVRSLMDLEGLTLEIGKAN
jgi:hypothetical protein